MSRWIIDASVLSKLLVPEQHSARAQRLLAEADELFSPDFMLLEVANVLWRRVHLAQLQPVEAQSRLIHASRLEVQLTPVTALLHPALEIAIETGRAVYDCCYMALAMALGHPCVTADQKLVRALSRTSYKPLAVWLGSLP